MQKIYWIIALIGLFVLGDRLGGFVLAKIVEQSEFRYSRLYTNRGACDILLVGNSRGLSFFQPYIEETSGKNTLNLSYNGMPVDLATVLIEDYFENYPAPKKLILDITLCDRFNPELIAGFNFYNRYSPNLSQLLTKTNPRNAYAGQLSHLFQYNSEVFQRALYYRTKTDKDWLLDRQITPELIQKVENEEYEFIIKYPPETPDLLGELVTKVQEKGTEVVLVINPYFPLFVERMTNLQDLKVEVEKATGLKVHDYSTAIQGKVNFGDLQHLNKKGSYEYIQLLQEEGWLAD